jgi:hypothetical protein
MVNHREYYKEEGGGFSQFQAMVSFMSLFMPVAHLCIKSAAIMH